MRVYAPDLWQPKPTPSVQKHGAYIRANLGVDPHLIAMDLRISPRTVVLIQRKLGLRCSRPEARQDNVGPEPKQGEAYAKQV